MKSMVLSCLQATTELLCTHCSLIGPHLVARGKSHDFSLFASRTWDIFSRDIRDGHTRVMLVQRHQESCLVERDHSPFSLRLESTIGTPNGGGREPGSLSTSHRYIGIPINIQEESGII